MIRVEYPGAIYHVMNRGDRREDIIRDDVDRQNLLKTMAEACQKTGFEVHAFCLMKNRFHLVVETPKGNLVEEMRWFLSSYTLRLNHRRKLFGHVFSGRYKALIVHDLRAGEGLLGIALALPTGRSFHRGTRQLARLSFESTTTNGSPDLKISFNDELVAMKVASVLAEALPAAFVSTGSGSTQDTATSGKFTLQGFEVTFAVLSDTAYVIEKSSDLTHWTPLATQVPVNGTVRFTDGHSGEASVRFYRARKATVGVGETSL